MQKLLNKLASDGFIIPALEMSGKILRFDRNGKNNAWFIGWLNYSGKDGKPYYHAEYGDWKTSEKFSYQPDKSEVLKDDFERMKKQAKEASEKREEELSRWHEEAANKCSWLWSNVYEDVNESDYLKRKQIDKLYGAKTYLSGDDRILGVPIQDVDGKLWNIQRIWPDGTKKFGWAGKIKGCFFLTNEPVGSAYICEGFATGASVHMATGRAVICAFNCGNITEVARVCKKKWSNVKFIILGDEDKWNERNVGREHAEKAAVVCMGSVVFPKFQDESSKPTDFNDLHVLEGLAAVKQQVECVEESTTGFIPLGFDEGVDYFYVFSSKNIVACSSYSEIQLFRLAPLEYWEQVYPSKIGVSWINAKNELIQLSRAVGKFDNSRIRGTGVWLDDKRVVINTGKELIIDGVPGEIQSYYVYVQTKNRMPALQSNRATISDVKPLIDAILNLKWRDTKFGYFLAGWLAIARIASALPIRPHVWLTGGSNTGKSTVMDRIIRPALGAPQGKLYLQGGSTEAGIRQTLKADCVPLIFDEFETDERNYDRIASLIELLRQTWSATQGNIVKGSASGVATQYALTFPALVSSIRVTLENDADRSRFSVLELMDHQNDIEHWEHTEKFIEQITEDLGERIFARSISMVHTILTSFRNISKALAFVTNQRMGQQYGMLLAGFYSLLSDDPANPEKSKEIVEKLNFKKEVREAITDEFECLTYLMTKSVKIGMSSGAVIESNIGEVITNDNKEAHDFLRKNYGILVDIDCIYVANQNTELARIYHNSRWRIWSKSLQRLPGAEYGDRKYFAGKMSRCTKIPIELIS